MNYEIRKIELNKGAKLLLLNGPETDIVSINCAFRAGALFAPMEKIELAHLTEHMLFLGTQKFPSKKEFAFEAEKHGSYINARTSYELLRTECISEKKHYLKMIELMLEQVFCPLLLKEVFNAEKLVVEREISQRLDNSARIVNTNLSKLINTDSLTPQEDLETLKNTTYADVLDFYKTHFTAANAHFLIAGSFSEQEIGNIAKLLNERLKKVPAGKQVPVKYRKLKKYQRKIASENKEDLRNAYFDLTFVVEEKPTELFPAAKIFHALYNVGHGSKIFNALRDSGLSYSTSSGYSLTGTYSEFYVTDNADAGKILESFDICLRELKQICDGVYSEEEFERAKSYAYGGLVRGNRVIDDLLGWYGTDFVLDREFDDYNEYKERILKVTREDIKKVSQLFFKKENWALSILGNDVVGKEKEFEKTLDKYFG